MVAKKTEEDKVKDAKNALTALKETRQPFEGEVDNIITYVTHGRRKITDKRQNKGKRTGTETYDSTALEAVNVFVDGLCGYTLSRSFRWFAYMLPGKMKFPKTSIMRGWSGKRLDEFPDVKVWLADFEEAMYSAFLKSNLYDIVGQVVRDAVSIGTVTPILEEDKKKERFVIQVPHFRECFLAEDRFGVVDTNYRVYDISLRNLVKKFGVEKMREVIPTFDTIYEKNPYQEKEVLHAIYPREDYTPGRLDRGGLPVAGDWFISNDTAPTKLIEESGYPEMPSFSWRWRKNGDEICGRSPVWDAMVEVMTAQQQGRTNLIAGQKAAEPPMVGVEDLRNKVNKGPQGWTWISNMENMPKPLVTGMQIPFSVEAQTRTDEKIRAHLQTDFFMLLSRAAMAKVELTATQVFEMSGEKAVIIAGRVGQMESEFMGPLHTRAVSIEGRAGRLPLPPDIILESGNSNYEIEYLGPFSQIQKRLYKSKGIRAGLEALTAMAQMFPEASLVIDPIQTARDLWESSGGPVKNFRDVEEVEAMIKQRSEAAMVEGQGPAIAKLLKAIPGLGKEAEEGSMLQKLLTEGGEGGG